MTSKVSAMEMGTAQLLVHFYDNNDEEALTEFFQKYKELAFRIAYGILGNQADADDVMQQTFIQVIKKQATCKAAYELQDAKVKSWLLSIVYNFARMHLRSQKSKKTYTLEEERMNMHPAKNCNAAEMTTEKSETSIKLKSAIFNLPEKYRVPILMHYHEEMSIEEISKTLTINPGTIRSILSRGVNMLRDKLSAEKVMLSSTAAIELIASVPYPHSQKTITLSFVKSCATAKTTSAKIAVTASSKSFVLIKSILAILAISSITAYVLINNQKPKVSVAPNQISIAPKPAPIENKLSPKLSWDFSKENGADLKTLYNEIIYLPNLKAITNAKGSEDKQSIINLEFKLVNYTRIRSMGKMLRSDFTKEKPINEFAIDFVALKNNKPLPGFLIYKKGKPLDIPNYKEIPYEQDICIIDNKITRLVKDHGIINVMRFDNLDDETEVGLLLSGLYLETITIEKMSPELVEDIRKKTNAVLQIKTEK